VFNRNLPTQFARARARLEPKLGDLGFELASETYLPEAFGSASCEYRQGPRGRRVRLVWDGKDCALWLAASAPGAATPSAADWAPLEATSIRPGSIRTVRYGESNLGERIAQLLLAVEEELDPPDA